MPDKLFKVPEAAELLSLSPKTVWSWIAQRRIGVVRMGGSVRVAQSEIDRLTTTNVVPALDTPRS